MGRNGDANGNGRKVSRINQSTCRKCGRAFWRWESKRTECLLCKPLTPRQTERTLKAAGCDQPAVLATAQAGRGSHPVHHQSAEVQPLNHQPSKILRLLFATRPS